MQSRKKLRLFEDPKDPKDSKDPNEAEDVEGPMEIDQPIQQPQTFRESMKESAFERMPRDVFSMIHSDVAKHSNVLDFIQFCNTNSQFKMNCDKYVNAILGGEEHTSFVTVFLCQGTAHDESIRVEQTRDVSVHITIKWSTIPQLYEALKTIFERYQRYATDCVYEPTMEALDVLREYDHRNASALNFVQSRVSDMRFFGNWFFPEEYNTNREHFSRSFNTLNEYIRSSNTFHESLQSILNLTFVFVCAYPFSRHSFKITRWGMDNAAQLYTDDDRDPNTQRQHPGHVPLPLDWEWNVTQGVDSNSMDRYAPYGCNPVHDQHSVRRNVPQLSPQQQLFAQRYPGIDPRQIGFGRPKRSGRFGGTLSRGLFY